MTVAKLRSALQGRRNALADQRAFAFPAGAAADAVSLRHAVRVRPPDIDERCMPDVRFHTGRKSSCPPVSAALAVDRI